jgi:arylsulfatase A-like enzyme
LQPSFPADSDLFERWFVHNKRNLSSRQTQLITDCYDDCLAYLDEQVGRLFAELRRLGELENTLVIVTADHGEHFGEHGLYGHASSLYDQEVRVPLLILGPGQGLPGGRVVREPVTLRDLAATVIDVVGLKAESPFPGRSLARLWNGAHDHGTGDLDDPLLSEVDEPVLTPPNQGRSPVFRGSMKALVANDQVYIRNGDGVEELYDVTTDPAETRDLARVAEYGPVVERFRAQLRRLMEGEPPLKPAKKR